MFSRKSCYFFVRPKRNFLELCIFLGGTLKAPQVRRSDRASKSKVYHIIHIKHGRRRGYRKELIKDAVGDPLPEPGQSAAEALPRRNNGIVGDARRSTPELGKMAFDMKVDYAVKQIQKFLANSRKQQLNGKANRS